MFALAGFVSRPQAVAQIGAVGWVSTPVQLAVEQETENSVAECDVEWPHA
jgi:hypothetical protein